MQFLKGQYHDDFGSPVCGVYAIVNITNGKTYIGSSRNMIKRIRSRDSDLKLHRHVNSYLQHAFYKYGAESFAWYVCEECLEDDLLIIEQRRSKGKLDQQAAFVGVMRKYKWGMGEYGGSNGALVR